jgi:phenylalanyl-tRNA synthetase beta chain
MHPRWVQKYELGTAPVVCELELDALLDVALPAYGEVSRLPTVVRDLALVVPDAVGAQALTDCLRAHAPGIVRELRLFDVYTGRGIAAGAKSLAFRIVMQDTEKTLADADADAALAVLVDAAAAAFGGRRRG